ncbi:MAG TPA: hypothetical protein VI756_04165 [Blastocatellia bacterium]
MKAKYSIVLALIAGFAGGFASNHLTPGRAYAKNDSGAPSVNAGGQVAPPAEISAHKFVLVDENGLACGVFGVESNGAPVIEITDSKRRVYVTEWDRPGHTIILGGPNCPRHPTLLPGN